MWRMDVGPAPGGSALSEVFLNLRELAELLVRHYGHAIGRYAPSFTLPTARCATRFGAGQDNPRGRVWYFWQQSRSRRRKAGPLRINPADVVPTGSAIAPKSEAQGDEPEES